MKSTILFILGSVALGSIATAQRLTLMPQLGLENSRTSIQYNNTPSFLPIGGQMSPYAGARLDYKTKKGHGVFIAAATNRSSISYDFSNLETGRSAYQVTQGDLKMNLQSGYMFSSKPIYFNKSAASKNKSSASKTSTSLSENTIGERSHCSAYRSHCGKNNTESSKTAAIEKDKGWSVSVQPSIGAAYKPSADESISTKTSGGQPVYSYNAGNWKLGVVTGVGFEFGKNLDRRFTINVNYLKGITNLDEKISSPSEVKPIVTNLSSKTSSWSVSAGIPITLNKKKKAVKSIEAQPQFRSSQSKCGRYKAA
ncbi:MAG: hypothetical protein H0X70_05650 [Segetibacter sp.]|nr:hypothetical protein [Segetibacter sp.]